MDIRTSQTLQRTICRRWHLIARTLVLLLPLTGVIGAEDAPKVKEPSSEKPDVEKPSTTKKGPGKTTPAPLRAKDADHDHDHEKLEGDLKAAASTSIQWKRSFEEALTVAEKLKRPLLVDFEAKWCGFCKKLDRETYAHASVIRFVTNTFVTVKIDVDKHPELQGRYNVTGLPTIIFFDAVPASSAALPAAGESTEDAPKPTARLTLQELGRIEGYRPPELFLHEARKAATAGKSLAELRHAAEENPKDADAQRAYARALMGGGKQTDAKTVLRNALKSLPGHPLIVFELADLDRLNGEFPAAAQSYRAVLASDEADEAVKDEVVVPLARCLMSLKKLEEAEKTLGRLLARLPVDVVTPKKASENGEEATAPDAAESKVDARFLEALFLRGYVRALLERPKDALADLQIAQNADPNGIWGFRASFIIARTR